METSGRECLDSRQNGSEMAGAYFEKFPKEWEIPSGIWK